MPQARSIFGSPVLAALASPALLSDSYFQSILKREAVDLGPFSPVFAAARSIQPYIDAWSNGFVSCAYPSGSFAKGTANRSGTDLDLFFSIRADVPNTLKEIHDRLFIQLESRGLRPKRQNVSIGIVIDGISIDLVPGRQLGVLTDDHSLYHKKTGHWRKTNVIRHIELVRSANRANEIRIMKLWRNQQGLEFPSFYLELAVIRALTGSTSTSLSSNILRALRYLSTVFAAHRYEDPANSANIISDDLTFMEKGLIQKAAQAGIGSWPYIIR